MIRPSIPPSSLPPSPSSLLLLSSLSAVQSPLPLPLPRPRPPPAVARLPPPPPPPLPPAASPRPPPPLRPFPPLPRLRPASRPLPLLARPLLSRRRAHLQLLVSALAVLLQPPQGLPRATRPLPSTGRRTVPRKSRSRPACRCVAPPCVWRGPRLDAVSVARRRRGSRPALHCTTWLADHEQYPTPLAASGIYRSEPASHRRSRMRGSVVRFPPLFLFIPSYTEGYTTPSTLGCRRPTGRPPLPSH